MSERAIARKGPFPVDVIAGQTYYWCACGRSAKQPFCDGAHQGSDIEPLAYVADENEEILFCGCKATRTSPFCDGSHEKL